MDNVSSEIVSLQPKGGVVYEYRRETSQSRASQQTRQMVQNPHRDIAVRQGDLVQNMAASRLKPISCRQEDGILFSSFASFFVSPSLMWRGFLVTLGQAASTPASTSFHSARFASLLYCPLLRRLRQHRSGTLPLQPRPASTPPAFCAARPLAICRPSGKPSPQAASAAVASRRVNPSPQAARAARGLRSSGSGLPFQRSRAVQPSRASGQQAGKAGFVPAGRGFRSSGLAE